MIDMTVRDMKLADCEHCNGFSVLTFEKDLDRIIILLSDNELLEIFRAIETKTICKTRNKEEAK